MRCEYNRQTCNPQHCGDFFRRWTDSPDSSEMTLYSYKCLKLCVLNYEFGTHQSPVTSHQSPVTNHQSFIVLRNEM